MNVLVIDDSETQRALMGQVVQSVGHNPILMSDGGDIVNTIKRFQAKLVLLDVVMPQVDGYKVCREIKKNAETKAVPVIMISSKSSPTDRLWGMKQGADDYLAKPFEPTELASLINQRI
jgi:twitching motility two-component system response regulator PilH